MELLFLGGEPTIQKDLKDFIIKIKSMGYKVKLDTNGTNPILLKELIDEHLIDYVAMDIKNDFQNYDKPSGVNNCITSNIRQSLDILINSNIHYEFRTTIVKEFHALSNIINILKEIGSLPNYYLQNFEDSEFVYDHNLHGFSKEELKEIQDILKKDYPNVVVRNL